MLRKLENFIEQHQLIGISDQVAIAVSGGMDSICACHLMNKLKTSFTVLHCNFNLRGKESDEDELFVNQLAELEFCKSVISKQFDTENYAKTEKIGVQQAARQLRYTWFDELYHQGVFNKLITAHHQNDNLETFFINLYRGSGIAGLAGIPVQRKYIVRPLLCFTRIEIFQYLQSNGISYREDSSNSSSKYLRNQFRLKILPQIHKILPDFETRSESSLQKVKADVELYQYLIAKASENMIKVDVSKNRIFLNVSDINGFPQAHVFLYHLIDKYGFNMDQCRQIISTLESGKLFTSGKYELLIDRAVLIIQAKSISSIETILIDGIGTFTNGTTTLDIKPADIELFKTQSKNNSEFVDAESIPFPLTLRPWTHADYIYPLGMQGKKLISDLLIDLKINLFDKREVLVLASKSEVYWILGLRISEKCKIKKSTTKILEFQMLKS